MHRSSYYNGNRIFACLLFILPSCTCHELYVPELPNESYDEPGDLVLGILLPVHLRSRNGELCSRNVTDLGLLQRMEAVAFTVREINGLDHLLPNHTLGFVMYDDCFTDLTALGQSMHFARSKPSQCGGWHRGVEPGSAYSCGRDVAHVTSGETTANVTRRNITPLNETDDVKALRHVPIVGMLGSESSVTTVEAAKIMSIFRIPHISYLASTPVLSNKDKYPGFRRMVPSDATQVKAIVALLKHFGWTFVNVLYASGVYGESAFKALVRETENTDICFSMMEELPHTMTMLDYVALVYDIINQQAVNVSVVIVFAPGHQGRDLLTAASNLPKAKGRITWLVTWMSRIEELNKIMQREALGMIALSYHSTNTPRFDHYFQSITVNDTPTLNPWIDKFWQLYHNCSINHQGAPACNENIKLADSSAYSPDKYTSLVVDSIYAFAYALDTILQGPCLNTDEDQLYSCIDMYMHITLQETNFTGNDGKQVSFDASGDRIPANYEIYNVQQVSHVSYKLLPIGMYIGDNYTLMFNGRDVQWTSGSEKPVSVCSEPCKADEGTVYQQKRCCWTCEQCRNDEYLWRLGDGIDIWSCQSCGENKYPNSSDRTQCVDIIATWLTIYDPAGIAFATIASVGILCCSCVLVVFILHRDHVLIKASSRELMFFMLAGIIVCYFFVVTFLIEPTENWCIMKMIGVSLSFTLIYSPMSIKSIRIYRIFESGKNMTRKLRLVSCRSQLILAAALVMLHGVIFGVWLSFTPHSYVETVTTGPGTEEIICTFPTPPFAASFLYNGILLITCAFFAFLTRKLPDNFNESRFIAFCVYSTLVIWLSVMPAYITATTSTLRVSLLCAILILNASVPLILIFFPKVYAVYCMSTETLHVRQVTHSHNNSHCAECLDKVAPDLMSTSSVTGLTSVKGGTTHAARSRASAMMYSTAALKRLTAADSSSSNNKVVPLIHTSMIAAPTICEQSEEQDDVDKWI